MIGPGSDKNLPEKKDISKSTLLFLLKCWISNALGLKLYVAPFGIVFRYIFPGQNNDNQHKLYTCFLYSLHIIGLGIYNLHIVQKQTLSANTFSFHLFSYRLLNCILSAWLINIFSNTNSLQLFCENSSLNSANFTNKLIFCVRGCS